MRECEATNHSCGAWIFQGKAGRGVWYDGAYAELKVDYLDENTVIITRTDVEGRSKGLTARYTGQFDGDEIHGSVTWTWPAVWGDKKPTGEWEAKFEHVSADEALQRGKEAAAAGDTIEAKRWSFEAAQGGNQEAQARLKQAMQTPPTRLVGGLKPAVTELLNQMYQRWLQQEAECAQSPACTAQRREDELDAQSRENAEEAQRQYERSQSADEEARQFRDSQNRDMAQ